MFAVCSHHTAPIIIIIMPWCTFHYCKYLKLKPHSFAIWSKHIEVKYITTPACARCSLSPTAVPIVATINIVSVPRRWLVSQQRTSPGGWNRTVGHSIGWWSEGRGIGMWFVQKEGQEFLSSDVLSLLPCPCNHFLVSLSLPVFGSGFHGLSTHVRSTYMMVNNNPQDSLVLLFSLIPITAIV